MSAKERSFKQDESDVPDFNLLASDLEPVTSSQYNELKDQLDAVTEFHQILAYFPFAIYSRATCINLSNNCVTPVTPAGVSNVF